MTTTELIPTANVADLERIKQAQRFLQEQASRMHGAALDHSKASSIAVRGDVERSDDDPVLRLPPAVLRFLAEILGTLAKGQPVSVVPREMEMTTQEAANMLNVSRPFLVKLLESKAIPFHKVGVHRRVRFQDLMTYKDKNTAAAETALDDMIAQAQKLDLGY